MNLLAYWDNHFIVYTYIKSLCVYLKLTQCYCQLYLIKIGKNKKAFLFAF